MLVHLGVGVSDAVQVGVVVQEASGIDALVEQLGQVDADRRAAAANPRGLSSSLG